MLTLQRPSVPGIGMDQCDCYGGEEEQVAGDWDDPFAMLAGMCEEQACQVKLFNETVAEQEEE
eukprot:2623378-Lingulodinium_polyedra.AAC.1